MVSDMELVEKVNELLRVSDLKKTTNNIVRKKLESYFGIDLSHKFTFLREQIDRFLQTQYHFSLDQTTDKEEEQEVEDGNDDVSDSDDDSFHKKNLTNNGSSSWKPINKFKPPVKQKKEKNKKRNNSAKFCNLSPKLQKFLGVRSMERAEVVKQLWNYVRDKNLQDQQDGQKIICDETLRDLLGVDSINILQINKALTKHIRSSVKSMRKDKQRKKGGKEDPDGVDLKANHEKRTYSGFLAPLSLSDALMKFLGTEERRLTRADVIKKVWEYIKERKLQDPYDKKTVICDEKLKELFNVDTFHGFTVSKLLTAHFAKT